MTTFILAGFRTSLIGLTVAPSAAEGGSALALVSERIEVMKPDFSIAHFMTKQPFKNSADAASLAESLHMAGLPDIRA